jgi:hypothetical protein
MVVGTPSCLSEGGRSVHKTVGVLSRRALTEVTPGETVDVNIFVAAGTVIVSAAVTTAVEVRDVVAVEALITRTLDTEGETWLLKRLTHLLLCF